MPFFAHHIDSAAIELPPTVPIDITALIEPQARMQTHGGATEPKCGISWSASLLNADWSLRILIVPQDVQVGMLDRGRRLSAWPCTRRAAISCRHRQMLYVGY
jgi:hypothetical protein